MIILQLEKKYWEKTRSKIRKLEENNPHWINHERLSKNLEKILDYSADILEIMDRKFNSVSTLSGSREDSTLRLEIDNDENSDYASFKEVSYYYISNAVIRKKMVAIGKAFSFLEEVHHAEIPSHSTEKPMIQNGTHCKKISLANSILNVS